MAKEIENKEFDSFYHLLFQLLESKPVFAALHSEISSLCLASFIKPANHLPKG